MASSYQKKLRAAHDLPQATSETCRTVRIDISQEAKIINFDPHRQFTGPSRKQQQGPITNKPRPHPITSAVTSAELCALFCLADAAFARISQSADRTRIARLPVIA